MTIKIDPTIRSNNVCEKIVGARSAFVQQVLKRHHDGLQIKQLAEEFGVGIRTVNKLLNAAETILGIKRQERATSNRMTQHQLDLASSLLENGCSVSSVARKLGVSEAAIRYRVKTGSFRELKHVSNIAKNREAVIRALENRINRMERMAKNGIF